MNYNPIEMINGIGQKYAQILRLCGVTSIKTLAESTPSILMQKINGSQYLYKMRVPSEASVAKWIKEAKRIQKETSA